MSSLLELAGLAHEVREENPDNRVAIKVEDFRNLVEIAKIADLINMEFRTDIQSVQCFDLNAIVNPLEKYMRSMK